MKLSRSVVHAAVCGVVIVAAAAPRAAGQIDSYRQAAGAYRDAASKAPADRRDCFLKWASYYDGVAASMTTGGPPVPREPGGDPGCPEGSAGSGSGVSQSGSPFGSYSAATAGNQNGVVAALGMLAGWASQRADESRQRWENADAEHKRREDAAEAGKREDVEDMTLAAAEGDLGQLLASILKGTPIDGADEYGASSLFRATEHNQVWAMRLLLQHGASPATEDTWGSTAFLEAAQGGNMQAALLLLAAGADPRHQPYHPAKDGADKRADLFGYHDLRRLITFAMKPDEDFRTRIAKFEKPSPKIDELNRAAANGDDKEVAALIGQGADPNGADEFSFTPLENAIIRGQLKVVTALLRLGANVELTNAFDQTPLMLAARDAQSSAGDDDAALADDTHFQILRALLDAGARRDPFDFARYRAADYFKNSGWGAKDQNKRPAARMIISLLDG